ncbi:MAG TPA: hypothetical protein VJ376_10125 [Pseudomonadota bacterium]|nr:hypothetical protein [Pseudomonadota bacterium]
MAAAAGEFCASTVGALGATGALGTAGSLGRTEALGAAGAVAGTGAVDAGLDAAGAAFGATSAATDGLSGATGAGAASRSSKVVITARTEPSVAVEAGAGETVGMEGLRDRMAPNTATHITTISAHAIAARRMAKLLR